MKPHLWRIGAALGAIGLLLCLGAEAGLAQRGHGGGGGGPHIGGGGPHFGGGAPHIGGGGPHFGGGAPHIGGGAPHFGGGAPRVGRAPHFGGGPHLGGGRIGHYRAPHGVHLGRPSRVLHAPVRLGGRGPGRLHRGAPGRVGHGRPIGHPIARTPRTARIPAAHVRPVNRRNFAAHRRFAANRALHAFMGRRWRRWHHWHHHHHLGWVGPLFWPYAFGDLFYCGLWPYDYCGYDPFWYYGYDDVYEGIFWPYDYQRYVQGSRAPARMTALTRSVAQSCTDEAAEVIGWPIDQIQAALQPNQQQTSLLDDLGNAVVKASDVIRSHCPTKVAFAPTGRLADMQERLQGLVQAVDIVQPPLAKFYDSLTDEQKARFNEIGVAGGKAPSGGQGAANPQAECGGSVMAFPTGQIERVVQPSDVQRQKLDALAAANVTAEDQIKASCPSELPATPPDRLAAEGRHLEAMLAAVQTIRPALDDFYTALSDEQKARFNNLGRQLFVEK